MLIKLELYDLSEQIDAIVQKHGDWEATPLGEEAAKEWFIREFLKGVPGTE